MVIRNWIDQWGVSENRTEIYDIHVPMKYSCNSSCFISVNLSVICDRFISFVLFSAKLLKWNSNNCKTFKPTKCSYSFLHFIFHPHGNMEKFHFLNQIRSTKNSTKSLISNQFSMEFKTTYALCQTHTRNRSRTNSHLNSLKAVGMEKVFLEGDDVWYILQIGKT